MTDFSEYTTTLGAVASALDSLDSLQEEADEQEKTYWGREEYVKKKIALYSNLSVFVLMMKAISPNLCMLVRNVRLGDYWYDLFLTVYSPSY